MKLLQVAAIALPPIEREKYLRQEGMESSQITEIVDVRIDDDENINDTKNGNVLHDSDHAGSSPPPPANATTDKNDENAEKEIDKDASNPPPKPVHYRITRSYKQSSQPYSPSDYHNNHDDDTPPSNQYYKDSANHDQRDIHRDTSIYRQPTPMEEEKFRICIVLITSWAFLVIAILFLVCYGYQLEWNPDTADPINVFSLELAVNMIYAMFIVDIIASIAIILSSKDHVEPFKFRIFWPAVVFLILNQIHGTIIWMWVWTGEFPRTCSRNSFYFGRRCENIDMLLLLNPGGKLRLSDCKCDYGNCVPECKGLRLIQNYFWGTYWIYTLRMVALIVYIPRLSETICQCKWCCCIMNPNERQRVVPAPQGSSDINHPENRPQSVNSQYHQDPTQSNDKRYDYDNHHDYQHRFREDIPVDIEVVDDEEAALDNNYHCRCSHNQRHSNRCKMDNMKEQREDKGQLRTPPRKGHTIICCERERPRQHRPAKYKNRDRCRSRTPTRILLDSNTSVGRHKRANNEHDDGCECEVKEVRKCKVIRKSNLSCYNENGNN